MLWFIHGVVVQWYCQCTTKQAMLVESPFLSVGLF